MENKFMKIALEEAEIAAKEGEMPVGAVIVKDGEVIAAGHNLRNVSHDPTLHAEIVAIRKAAELLEDWRLSDCEMYVTLEPCPMCAGAILNARLGCVYYALKDANAGAMGSVLNLNSYPLLYKVRVEKGECEEESRNLLSAFFKARR